MRRITVVTVVLIVLCSFTYSSKKKFIPPGTVQITETFFADETEVSNFSWREYEYWIKAKYGPNSAEHKSVLPDTTVWRHKQYHNEPYVQHYYRHSAYKDYPVVGVSFEQVVAFCKWRTDRVKEFYARRNKKELKIEYRLPTKEEWENLAMAYPYDIFKARGMNEKGQALANFVRAPGDSVATASMMNDNADVTAPVYSYWKNGFGLYNIFGNVAEMVSEKGISKGGAWRFEIEEARPGKNMQYDAPTAWLGFRCVAELEVDNR